VASAIVNQVLFRPIDQTDGVAGIPFIVRGCVDQRPVGLVDRLVERKYSI
jgi:hypothetical protein